ncbi:alpha/beta hydrolase [Streptomyces sp. T-3]|nr:alpha/beta hydrolase [Streptomyces sp. T-3]
MASDFSRLFKQDFSDLKAASASFTKLSTKLDGAFDAHRTKVTGPLHASWEGDDAERAMRFLEDIETRIQVSETETMAIGKVLEVTLSGMERAQKDLRAVVNSAEAQHYRIDDDGSVRLPQEWEVPRDDESDEDRHKRQVMEAQLQDYQAQINRAVDDALRASGEGQKALAELNGEILDHKNKQMAAETATDVDKVMDRLGEKGPQIPGNPKDAAEWWKGLDADQQREYTTLYPDRIGATDGLPSDVRDDANRQRLEQELSLTTRGDVYEGSQRHHNLQVLKDELDKHDGAREGKELYLLDHDAGGDGKVVIAMGNPDTADNVGVQVPGTATTMDSTGGQLGRISKLQDAAVDADGSADTSMVYWLGYDAPEVPVAEAGNLGVAGRGRAEDAAPDLRDFTHGLRASHEGERANLTVLGHSYGSTTVGIAANGDGGLDADRIAVVGSPGMGVGRADDLNIDPDNFYVGEAGDDPIQAAQDLTLGEDPSNAIFFGGNKFVTDTSGHSGYWDEGSQSLANQGRIIAGREPTPDRDYHLQ